MRWTSKLKGLLIVSFCGREIIMNCCAILHDYRCVKWVTSITVLLGCWLWLERFGQRVVFLLCVYPCDVSIVVWILLHYVWQCCVSNSNFISPMLLYKAQYAVKSVNVFPGIRMACSPFLLQLVSMVFTWCCKYKCYSFLRALQIQFCLFLISLFCSSLYTPKRFPLKWRWNIGCQKLHWER